jgi:hypothetical protein
MLCNDVGTLAGHAPASGAKLLLYRAMRCAYCCVFLVRLVPPTARPDEDGDGVTCHARTQCVAITKTAHRREATRVARADKIAADEHAQSTPLQPPWQSQVVGGVRAWRLAGQGASVFESRRAGMPASRGLSPAAFPSCFSSSSLVLALVIQPHSTAAEPPPTVLSAAYTWSPSSAVASAAAFQAVRAYLCSARRAGGPAGRGRNAAARRKRGWGDPTSPHRRRTGATNAPARRSAARSHRAPATGARARDDARLLLTRARAAPAAMRPLRGALVLAAAAAALCAATARAQAPPPAWPPVYVAAFTGLAGGEDWCARAARHGLQHEQAPPRGT